MEFLNDEAAAGIDSLQLRFHLHHYCQHCLLGPADERFLRTVAAEHRLWYAVEVVALRGLGTFLPDPAGAEPELVAALARQLRLPATTAAVPSLPPHVWRARTARIRAYLGYEPFAARQVAELVHWLGAELLAHPVVAEERLLALTTAHLVAARVVLPEPAVLARLIRRVRKGLGQGRAAHRTYRPARRRPGAGAAGPPAS